MGQKQSLWTQLLTKIVNGPKTIGSLAMTGDVVTFTVATAEFDKNTVRLLGKREAQIQPPIPKFSAGFQLLPRIPVQARRRRHSTKESVDHHDFLCSYLIEKSGPLFKSPTIKSKFSRMRKTGV